MSRKVTHDGAGSLQIRFPYDRTLVDRIKSLPDRRWNPSDRFWSVPQGSVLELVELLQPYGFVFDDETRALYEAQGGQTALSAPSITDRLRTNGQPGLFAAPEDAATPIADSDDYSVTRLNNEVRALLEGAFPSMIWLVGEISGFNKGARKRIVGFQLAEREDGGRTLSEINAVLFESTRRELERKLVAAGDPFRLEDEVTVRVRVRVDLYVPWGLYRVVVEDLDIHYTLGEAARRREEIVRQLTEEGLVGLNTALELPVLPLRVGLITSLGSDAYNDVVRTLQESGFAFSVRAHGARVQGPSTEGSVLNALDWFRQRHTRFDVVLICRGGGSRIDLAWFDSQRLGRAVAEFPLPVLIGIGHEQDQSVLDAVGWSNKTPTATAAFVVAQVQRAVERTEELGRHVLELAARRVREERTDVVDRAGRLVRAARHLLEQQRSELAHRQRRAVVGTRARVQRAGQELTHRALTIPRQALMQIAGSRGQLDRGVRQLLQSAGRDVESTGRRLRELTLKIGPGSLRWVQLERERSERRARRLDLVHPQRVIARGYAILRGDQGQIITRPAQAPAKTALTAELRDGRLALRSLGARDDTT